METNGGQWRVETDGGQWRVETNGDQWIQSFKRALLFKSLFSSRLAPSTFFENFIAVNENYAHEYDI